MCICTEISINTALVVLKILIGFILYITLGHMCKQTGKEKTFQDLPARHC